MKFSRFALFVVAMIAFAVLAPVFAQDATPESTPEGTPEATVAPAAEGAIVLNAPSSFIPEGMTYDSVNARFLVGSIAQGTIFAVADDGTVTPFIQDKALMGTFGLRADANKKRLYVTNADPSPYFGPDAKGNMMLGIYDLTSGALIHMVDLNAVAPDGRHADNDVTFDRDGNIYTTDSFSPVIYKVDPDGNASVFLTDPQFTSDSIGLNGLAYNVGGFLIVSNLGAGKLFKVPLSDPKSFTEITLENPISVDGMAFAPDGTLLVVGAQADQTLYKLSSDDGWKSAKVSATFDTSQLITAVTLEGVDPYVLYTSFDANPPPGTYQIVPATFSSAS